MKCLSLTQPWATLIVLGAKLYETRTWQTPYRGRIAIHASRKFPDEARTLCRLEPFRSLLVRGGFRQSADLATGALLGTVELVDCLPTEDAFHLLQGDPVQRALGDYRADRWAWQLRNARLLPAPRHFTGRLGLFDIPDVEMD